MNPMPLSINSFVMSNEETKTSDPQPVAQSAMIGHPVDVPPVAMVYMPDFGHDPVSLECPNCKNKIISKVEHESQCGKVFNSPL